MVGQYQPYPAYKDSGETWLGEIPVEWWFFRLKYTVSIFGRIGFRGYTVDDIVDKGEGAIVVSPSNIEEDKFTIEKKVYLSWNKYYESPEIMVENGDVLVVKTGSSIGKATIVREVVHPMTINPQMALLKKAKIDPRYIHYLFNSSLIKGKIAISNTGSGMPTMTQENINNFPILKPPSLSAIQIANFLDHETAKIDTLIAKQEKLIELLQEKRQAVISHAVTKGLDPDVPMKDSGVEWLGEVPAHWGISSLSYYAELNTGSTPDRSNRRFWNGDIPWVKTGEVKYERIYQTEEYVTQDAVNSTSIKIAKPGTLLMAMYGQGGTRGRVAILGIEATYNQACVAITPNPNLLNEYLRCYFMGGYRYLRDGGNETSQMNLNADIIGKFKILIPPLNEQNKIVAVLDKENKHFDQLLFKVRTALELLQERRTALISAAVTGKIDVRNWEPNKNQAT
jgi:type I restriction enzyme S subunit